MAAIEDAHNRAIARWNAGDLDGYLELYDERLRLHGYSAEPLSKSDAAKRYAMVWQTLAALGRRSPRLEVKELFSSGNRLACRFVMSGSHQGSFMGVPATGRSYEMSGMTIMHFDHGRVVERWSLTDRLSVLIQIGAFVPPG
jgi:ketosteroid isomerase-like protein